MGQLDAARCPNPTPLEPSAVLGEGGEEEEKDQGRVIGGASGNLVWSSGLHQPAFASPLLVTLLPAVLQGSFSLPKSKGVVPRGRICSRQLQCGGRTFLCLSVRLSPSLPLFLPSSLPPSLSLFGAVSPPNYRIARLLKMCTSSWAGCSFLSGDNYHSGRICGRWAAVIVTLFWALRNLEQVPVFISAFAAGVASSQSCQDGQRLSLEQWHAWKYYVAFGNQKIKNKKYTLYR